MTATEKKLGVYLCGGCGIAEAASLDALEKVAVKEFKAPFCKKHDYLCGEDGLKLIRDDAAAGTMNQAVIAACSPRVNQDKFRFDGVQVVRANLREQVAWTQTPGKDDTEMAAADYIRMAITEARKIKVPVPFTEGPFNERILVVGGGLTGLTAAREAAKCGYPVLLVEQAGKLGGHALNLTKLVPHHAPYRSPEENKIASLVAAVEAEFAHRGAAQHARHQDLRHARQVRGGTDAERRNCRRRNRWRHRARHGLDALRRIEARPSGLRRVARRYHLRGA